MIKALFFAAAGTLIYLPKSVGWHYQLVARRHGWDVGEASLNAAFRAGWMAMPARQVLRSARPDDDKGWWRELVGSVLDACAAPAALDRGAFFEELYAHFAAPRVWALFPEVETVLAELRGGFQLGVISNFDGRLRTILRQLGLARHFDFVAISSEAGSDKPDAFIFQMAMKQLNVKPDESLHVGDDPSRDWAGAEAVGMHSFHLERSENSLAELASILKT